MFNYLSTGDLVLISIGAAVLVIVVGLYYFDKRDRRRNFSRMAEMADFQESRIVEKPSHTQAGGWHYVHGHFNGMPVRGKGRTIMAAQESYDRALEALIE